MNRIMNFPEKNIRAFSQLVKTHRHLFSDADRIELSRLVETHKSNLEELSEGILAWSESHLIAQHLAHVRITLSATDTPRLFEDDPPSHDGAENCVNMLDNALQDDSPPPPPPPLKSSVGK